MKKAIIIFSGGIDSTTCLALAKSQGYACYTLSFDYGQRHRIELNYAANISQAYDVVDHHIFHLDLNHWKSSSALTDHDLAVPNQRSEDVPITYVPARNSIFLSVAMGWAEALDCHDIFLGVNADDELNYPDCRPQYLRAFEKMASLATRAGVEGQGLRIHTPLLKLNKVEIIRSGLALGIDYDQTFSCYDPKNLNVACGVCDACDLRKKAFAVALHEEP